MAAFDKLFPWLAHNAMITTRAARAGTVRRRRLGRRQDDLRAGGVPAGLEHDAPVRGILKTVFAQRLEEAGDWPQWFMLDPYAPDPRPPQPWRRDRLAAEALCDYVRATGDLTILDEPVA